MTDTQTYRLGQGYIQIGDQEPIKCKSFDVTVPVIYVKHGDPDPVPPHDREVHVKAEPA